ncbi:major facilitator superfamily domain-containing protein [Mycena sp. CBHHK59/15]|nr:major facilitator superfamily domain-containing protein [Mycena sp. CBHHK59/15]
MIDSTNYKTAYVSGMKEELDLSGDELNYMNTTYRIGYALFLIPSQLFMTRIRPSVWLPALELFWGLLTGLMALASSAKIIYVLRFFIGAAEASSYPGILSILCCWYTPDELAKRIAIFGTSYPAASIFTSFMQVGLYKAFIFNALMTVIVAATGFFFVPDTPDNCKVPWLTPAQRELAKARMARTGRASPVGLSIASLKATFSSWPLYVFTGAYSTWTWAQQANTWVVLFLKAEKNPDGTNRFDVAQINLIPNDADSHPHRLPYFVCVARQFWAQNVRLFILWTSNAVGPILVAWMAEMGDGSAEERAIILGVCLTLANAVDSVANGEWFPLPRDPAW